jgi:P-type E1-E2 ATPase
LGRCSGSPHIWSLYAVVIAGGGPLVFDLLRSLWRRQFGADLLAGLLIVTSLALGEPLAGAIVVSMLSGGETLEALAVSRASAVLDALAWLSPTVAHRVETGSTSRQEPTDVAAEEVRVGDHLVVFPHELCPVDGVVIEGTGRMDEAYLTGEPYEIRKAPGSAVISGAVNGAAALTIRATAPAADSRYARIMQVMKEADENRPPIRRLADKLGAAYTPFAVAIALSAWAVSGDPVRMLAVLVVATPCPLLIGIPVALVGAVSLAAKRGIVIRDPSILERLDTCKVLVLDKTGTLTVSRPSLADVGLAEGFDLHIVLGLAASAEVYSKHPLARSLARCGRCRGHRALGGDR